MLYYRVYFFDGVGSHIEQFREFEAKDDDQALATAESWYAGRPMELWNRTRRLKRWQATQYED